MLCIALECLVTNEPPWGFIYKSTSSMDGGDLIDPTVDIVHPEYSIQISEVLHKCGVVWNSLEPWRAL